jgi:zinc D-Ala-D-Ala carboxypeptidase
MLIRLAAAVAALTVLLPGAAHADDGDGLQIGPGAQDTFSGSLPDNQALTAFDVGSPIINLLDPALLAAVQAATKAAAADGVQLQINSGWRSPGFQQRLFDEGVVTYGSVEAAKQFVASPQTSMHVQGKAVDIGPPPAAEWMAANGIRFGLCQVYANERWHYELTARAGVCPPMLPNAAG